MSDDDLKALCQGAVEANPKAVEDIKTARTRQLMLCSAML